MPYRTCPSVYQPRRCTGAPVVVVPQPLERGELDRLVGGDGAAAQSPTTTCAGRGERGGRQRDRERDALVAAPAPAQPPHA